MTEKIVVKTDNAPAAIGPYSVGVCFGNLIFTAGQLGIDPKCGEIVKGGIGEETRQALTNIQTILNAAGTKMDKVIKTTVYLKDMEEFVAMNAVYAEFFTDNFPARTTVQVAALPKQAAIEIEAIAII
jgi:2-iminobutanoate/2-iminopropanoate deaminase